MDLTAGVLAVASLWMASGCANGPGRVGPLSAISEARIRAKVQKQASADPFPSAADVGLK